MEKILVLDNYDSFTYNLVHAIAKLTEIPVEVHRNDQISLDDVDEFSRIVLSPGPGIPDEAGILKDLIKSYATNKKIFGVCLGMQAIAEVFGGSLINMEQVMHGVARNVNICGPADLIFKDLPDTFIAGRYHSWVVSDKNIPSCLMVTARDENGQIMALRHTECDICGVQFHPESVLTPLGERIIANWLNS